MKNKNPRLTIKQKLDVYEWLIRNEHIQSIIDMYCTVPEPGTIFDIETALYEHISFEDKAHAAPDPKH